MTDSLASASIGAALGFLAGWALKYVGPKSQVVYWFPHASFFPLPQQGSQNPLQLITNTVIVQNLGRHPAKNVEVVYSTVPTHLTMTPSRTYTQGTTPPGYHVITVPSLGHNEGFTIEVLGIGTAPAVMSVRSEDGAAKMMAVMPQRIWPWWVNWSVGILMLAGAVFLLYWALRGLQALARYLGIL